MSPPSPSHFLSPSCPFPTLFLPPYHTPLPLCLPTSCSSAPPLLPTFFPLSRYPGCGMWGTVSRIGNSHFSRQQRMRLQQRPATPLPQQQAQTKLEEDTACKHWSWFRVKMSRYSVRGARARSGRVELYHWTMIKRLVTTESGEELRHVWLVS